MIHKSFEPFKRELSRIIYGVNSYKVAMLTLNYTRKLNSFGDVTIQQILIALDEISSIKDVRMLILNATGQTFCSGADIGYLRGVSQLPPKNMLEANLPLAMMLKKYHELPFPTICEIQGDSYGGGLGLIAASTKSIAVDGYYCCFSEAKLGLIPAIISPYVVDRIGEHNARNLFTSAIKFSVNTARKIGLIDQIVSNPTELKITRNNYIKHVLETAPNTYKDVNNLLNVIRNEKRENLPNRTAELLSEQLQKDDAKQRIDEYLLKKESKKKNK